jgi:hypothetical protein
MVNPAGNFEVLGNDLEKLQGFSAQVWMSRM